MEYGKYRGIIFAGVASIVFFMGIHTFNLCCSFGAFLSNPSYKISAELMLTAIIFLISGFTYFHLENHKLMNELQSTNQNLETIIEDRTEEQLTQEKMATVGKFTSMIGHDLRSPLQTIKNAVYISEKFPDEQEKMMQIIAESTDYASKILEDLRDLTRNTDPVFSDVVLQDFLEQTIMGYRTNENITFTIDIEEGITTAHLDALKMRRVVDNLVKNAVEATPKSGEVKLSACEEGGCLKIEISDTGKGIPEEYLNNLFKPFNTTKSGGLGLGLAYCKQAVEAHKGEIFVDSELDKGSKFTIKIPMK